MSEFDRQRFAPQLQLYPVCELAHSKDNEDFYLVMGKEGTGLREEELQYCDACVTIPTNGKYGILNLCQATTICLYEFTKNFYSRG